MNATEKRMLEQLDEVRKASEQYSADIVVAYGNGTDIVATVERAQDEIKGLKEKGYWLVNRFYKGQPIGFGA